MDTTTSQKSVNIPYMVELGALIAIVFIMAFTPLGYIPMPGIKISLMVIPVAVGAILLGPKAGMLLGGIFGLTSVIQSMTGDGLGPMMMQISPISNIIVRLPTRMLMGWLVGVIYLAVKNSKASKLAIPVACISSPILNTIFYMTTLCALYFNKPEIQEWATQANLPVSNVFAFIAALVGFNALFEAGASLVVGTAITKALMVALKKNQ